STFPMAVAGQPTDGTTAVGVYVGSSNPLANASAKLISIMNATVEKAYVDPNGDGAFNLLKTLTAPTANSTGTVVITYKSATAGAVNAGWMPIKDNAGNVGYVPYWTAV
ncbi:MAG: hypothetical protein AAB649_07420, partial [Patescibacteria group bacterium]